eukprot:gene9537-9701_t
MATAGEGLLSVGGAMPAAEGGVRLGKVAENLARKAGNTLKAARGRRAGGRAATNPEIRELVLSLAQELQLLPPVKAALQELAQRIGGDMGVMSAPTSSSVTAPPSADAATAAATVAGTETYDGTIYVPLTDSNKAVLANKPLYTAMIYGAQSSARFQEMSSAAAFTGSALDAGPEYLGSAQIASRTASGIYLQYYARKAAQVDVAKLLNNPSTSVPLTQQAMDAWKLAVRSKNQATMISNFVTTYGNYVLVGYRRSISESFVIDFKFASPAESSAMRAQLLQQYQGEYADASAAAAYFTQNPSATSNLSVNVPATTYGAAPLCPPFVFDIAALRSGRHDEWQAALNKFVSDCNAAVSKFQINVQGKSLTGQATHAILVPITALPAWKLLPAVTAPQFSPSGVLNMLRLENNRNITNLVYNVWGGARELQRLAKGKNQLMYQASSALLNDTIAAVASSGRNCTADSCSRLMERLQALKSSMDQLRIQWDSSTYSSSELNKIRVLTEWRQTDNLGLRT